MNWRQPARILALVGGGLCIVLGIRSLPMSETTFAPYEAPPDAIVSVFEAPRRQASSLTIEAATDISYMRPFIDEYQKRNPDTRIVYVDFISSALFDRASRNCYSGLAMPDLYLTVSTDHLVELANRSCSTAIPKSVAEKVPAWAQWRREVIAFAIEPAVIVYNRSILAQADVPTSHLELIELLRSDRYDWSSKIGTYDIELSGLGYNYAAFDARHSAIYGRLIESLGRAKVLTYCCSKSILDSVVNGKIALAYNVQMSYAYAAQAEGHNIGVIVPSDYQAIQTRSVMLSRQPRNLDTAIEFVKFLVSPEGQEIANKGLIAESGASSEFSPRRSYAFAQTAIGPSLLSLRDRARRESFIKEWKQAITLRDHEMDIPETP